MRAFIIAHSLPSRNPTNKAKIPIGKIKIPTKKAIPIRNAIHKQIIIIVIVIIYSPLFSELVERKFQSQPREHLNRMGQLRIERRFFKLTVKQPKTFLVNTFTGVLPLYDCPITGEILKIPLQI